jgi:hypothetical protein
VHVGEAPGDLHGRVVDTSGGAGRN